MPDSSPEPLIGAYFDGTLGPADAERVQAFLEETPSRRGFMAGVRAALRGEDIAKSPYDTVTAVSLLVEKLQDDHERPQDTGLALTGRELKRQPPRWSVFKRQPLRQRAWYTLAGAVLGMTILVVGWYAGMAGLGAHRPMLVLTYMTGNGERANITLPDGNTVALNVASHLDVPTDYMTGNHTLHLRGEALFTVTHHVGAPFTVIAGATTTRVLGTSFAVRHYATDTSVLVAVQAGKVAVGSAVVATNQLVEVGRHGVMRSSPAEPAAFSFAMGTLVLHRLRLLDAIPELDRWYDADIRLGDAALGNQEMNGKFAVGSLSDLESILGLTFDVHVVRDGRVLTLSSK